jgi:hypothetical protein
LTKKRPNNEKEEGRKSSKKKLEVLETSARSLWGVEKKKRKTPKPRQLVGKQYYKMLGGKKIRMSGGFSMQSRPGRSRIAELPTGGNISRMGRARIAALPSYREEYE